MSTTGKSLWETGFTLVLLYNTGNIQRQAISEIFQKELAAVNPKFVVEPLEMDWPAYQTNLLMGKIPIFPSSWIEDYHDTLDWIEPYTIGVFGTRQMFPQVLWDQFADIVERGVAQVDPVQRAAIYAEFNQLYYEQAPALLLFFANGRHYQRRWVNDWFSNPARYGLYFYALSKN